MNVEWLKSSEHQSRAPVWTRGLVNWSKTPISLFISADHYLNPGSTTYLSCAYAQISTKITCHIVPYIVCMTAACTIANVLLLHWWGDVQIIIKNFSSACTCGHCWFCCRYTYICRRILIFVHAYLPLHGYIPGYCSISCWRSLVHVSVSMLFLPWNDLHHCTHTMIISSL